jgi:5'-3' exonuclease
VEIIKPEKRKESTDPYTFISTNINNCNPKEQLFCKILSGDKSDNIPNIYRGCGQQTALKFYKDKQSFEDKLKDDAIKTIYELNKILIDMNNIPDDLKKEFYEDNLSNKPEVLKKDFVMKRLYKLRPRKYVNDQLKYRNNPYYNFRTTNYINYSNKISNKKQKTC